MILTFHDRHLVFINSDADITESVFAEKCIFRLSSKTTETSVIALKLQSEYIKTVDLLLMHLCRDLVERYHIQEKRDQMLLYALFLLLSLLLDQMLSKESLHK